MAIIITAKRDGFRRCGIAHSTQGTAYPDDFFTAKQLAQLKREPQLVVVEGAELAPGQEIDDAGLDQAPYTTPAAATAAATAATAAGKAKSARSLKAKEETPPETALTAAPEGEQAGAQAVVGSETEVAPSEGNGE